MLFPVATSDYLFLSFIHFFIFSIIPFLSVCHFLVSIPDYLFLCSVYFFLFAFVSFLSVCPFLVVTPDYTFFSILFFHSRHLVVIFFLTLLSPSRPLHPLCHPVSCSIITLCQSV